MAVMVAVLTSATASRRHCGVHHGQRSSEIHRHVADDGHPEVGVSFEAEREDGHADEEDGHKSDDLRKR